MLCLLIVVDRKKKRLLAGRRQGVIVRLGPLVPSSICVNPYFEEPPCIRTPDFILSTVSTRPSHPSRRAAPTSSRRSPRRTIAALASRSARRHTPRRHHRATHAGKETHARDPSDRASPHATGAQIRDTELLEIGWDAGHPTVVRAHVGRGM